MESKQCEQQTQGVIYVHMPGLRFNSHQPMRRIVLQSQVNTKMSELSLLTSRNTALNTSHATANATVNERKEQVSPKNSSVVSADRRNV